jgi:hypothetical protein
MKMKLQILLMTVTAILPISLVGCNGATRITLEQALETVNSATTEIDSFHMTVIGTYPGDFIERGEFDFVSPDKGRLVMHEQDIETYEMRVIGNNVYVRDSEIGSWELLEGEMAEIQVSGLQTGLGQLEPEATATEYLEKLDNINVLADEVINGVVCEHYRGSYDFWNLDALREAIENETDSEIKANLQEELETMEQDQEEQEMTGLLELWLGKDDHILRQTRNTTSWKPTEEINIRGTLVSAGTTVTIVGTTMYTNFNEPVEIEAPVLE